MKKKSGKIKSFIHKLRFRYRVSVLNENTLEEAWHVRLSRLSFVIYSSALVLITFFILTVLIFSTPLKYYLPGYADGAERSNIIHESMVTDSLLNQVKLQQGYIKVIKDIISGKEVPDSVASLDSTQLREHAKALMETPASEKEFVKNYENEEKYNLSTLPTSPNDNNYVFFKPVKGVISSRFDAAEKHYGISMATSPNETVVSVLDGTVIYAGYTFNNGWVIEVQHANNYISIYKNNTRLLKKTGDKVEAGESLAITGDPRKNTNQFYFELWQKGKPVNPENVIIF